MEFILTDFVPVGARAWRAVAEPATVTIGLVAGDAGCLVVDTGSSPAQGRAIRAAAATTAGVPVVAALATHHHYDHLFGLAAFADVATHGHASLAASLAAHAGLARECADLGIAAADVVLPGRPFRRGVDVDLGGRTVRIEHLGPAHTPGDAVVVVADADLVFVGDLVEEAGDPSIEPETTLGGWVRALDRLLALAGPGTTIVPGHGRPVDRAFVAEQRAWLQRAARGAG